ncbi:hypothetical protein CJ030_MR0G008879 [Morella rubra]|uniref:Uncharacterized protein n=1 Tax=Morella rubra TaxID=262757 RepID=A0A6A1UI81_9ROSI|nr:hypothetical protein CJ030_MR0G008879 [Morella rubra]
MSRCFPYPPPGYVKNGIRDEALIESIKLQREEERARKERKKEKQREKKEKEKALKDGEIDHTRQRHKKRPREERRQKDRKGRDHQNEKKAEAENIEKSSLTEEHGHPVDSQNSSDSTLNSSKRWKQSSPQDSRRSLESVFRIRLPLQRQKDPEVLPNCLPLQRQKDPEVLPNCLPLQRQKDPEVLPSTASASRRTDAAVVQGVCEPASRPDRDLGEPSCSTSGNVGQELIFRIRKEKSFTSFEVANSFAHKIEPIAPSILSGGRSPTEVSQFRDLIENWVPPPIQSEDEEFHDLEWLLGTKRKLNHADERCKVGSDSSTDQIFTPWLHARYLPEVDISALPYTLPF